MNNQIQACDICGETIITNESSRVSADDMKKAIEQGLKPQFSWPHVQIKCKNLELATGINLNEFYLSWKRTIERSSEISPDLFLCTECKKRFRDYNKQNRAEESKGCFIATACYGSSDCSEIIELRCFRDSKLLTSRLGALAVNLYYRFSPQLADYLTKKPKIRGLIRKLFFSPIIKIIRINK